MDGITKKTVTVTAFLGLSFLIVSAQSIDTLIYFDETDSLEMSLIIDDVSDLGVKFTPDLSWNSFDIIQFGFLTPEPFPYNETLHIFNANGENNYPGDLYDSFSVLFNDSSQTYPFWNIVDVSSHESMQNITGDFWVTGSVNFITFTVLDTNLSGHTFPYFHAGYPCAPCWGNEPSFDITVRAVVAINDSLFTINSSNSLNNGLSGLIINAYPNPFNSNQKISINVTSNFLLKEPVLNIYSIMGKKIFSKKMLNGINTFYWDGLDLKGDEVSSGVYIISIKNGRKIENKKIIMLK